MVSPCALLGALLLSSMATRASAAVPLYTNEDLDRVHPYRGQTGVLCVPAVDPAATPTPVARHGRRGATPQEATEERYWRREASRHRQRIARLERATQSLRRQMEQQQKQRGAGKRPGGASVEAIASRLADKQAEIADAEAEFEERSRRAGALPGWLR
jgi:hypothetical protein